MNLSSLSRALILAASAGALIASSFGDIAHAITDTVFRYSSLKTGYLSLLPGAFAPGDSVAANNYAIAPQFYILTNHNGGLCFDAGIHLPEGARMTSLKAWGKTDTGDGVNARIVRANLATGDADEVAFVGSTDTSGTRFAMTTPIPSSASAIINNEHYGYAAEVCIGTAATEFYSARITYVYRDAGD